MVIGFVQKMEAALYLWRAYMLLNFLRAQTTNCLRIAYYKRLTYDLNFKNGAGK